MKPWLGFGNKMNENKMLFITSALVITRKYPLLKYLKFFLNKFIEIRYKYSQVCEEMAPRAILYNASFFDPSILNFTFFVFLISFKLYRIYYWGYELLWTSTIKILYKEFLHAKMINLAFNYMFI